MSVGGEVCPSVGFATPGWPACAAPHTAAVLVEPSALKVAGTVGAKPPWNQPQLMRLALRRSPTLGPAILICTRDLGLEQSSSSGCGSPITVPCGSPPATKVLPEMLALVGVGTPFTGTVAWTMPCVCPAMRLSAPTVDGPKFEPNELSFKAKRWA